MISDSRVTNVKTSFVLEGGVQFITSSNGGVLTTEEPRVKCWEKKTFPGSVVWVGDQELLTETIRKPSQYSMRRAYVLVGTQGL